MAARVELLQTLVRTWMAASMYNVLHTCQVSKQGPKQNHSENICYFLQTHIFRSLLTTIANFLKCQFERDKHRICNARSTSLIGPA